VSVSQNVFDELEDVSVHCNPRVCTTSGLVSGPEDKKGQYNARLAGDL
jgi:hypothetical protein